MCGVLASAESAALEINNGAGVRRLEISGRIASALRTLSNAGLRRMIPVAVSTVVLICIASYFTFRSRTAGKTPAAVPAVVGTSSQPNIQEVTAPKTQVPEEVMDVHPAKPQPEESPKTNDADPTALWSRVRKGDAEAEVALAKLYLAGIGVERSCEQAHVLLLAASRKQNKAADSLLTGAYTQQCQ